MLDMIDFMSEDLTIMLRELDKEDFLITFVNKRKDLIEVNRIERKRMLILYKNLTKLSNELEANLFGLED